MLKKISIFSLLGLSIGLGVWYFLAYQHYQNALNTWQDCEKHKKASHQNDSYCTSCVECWQTMLPQHQYYWYKGTAQTWLNQQLDEWDNAYQQMILDNFDTITIRRLKKDIELKAQALNASMALVSKRDAENNLQIYNVNKHEKLASDYFVFGEQYDGNVLLIELPQEWTDDTLKITSSLRHAAYDSLFFVHTGQGFLLLEHSSIFASSVQKGVQTLPLSPYRFCNISAISIEQKLDGLYKCLQDSFYIINKKTNRCICYDNYNFTNLEFGWYDETINKIDLDYILFHTYKNTQTCGDWTASSKAIRSMLLDVQPEVLDASFHGCKIDWRSSKYQIVEWETYKNLGEKKVFQYNLDSCKTLQYAMKSSAKFNGFLSFYIYTSQFDRLDGVHRQLNTNYTWTNDENSLECHLLFYPDTVFNLVVFESFSKDIGNFVSYDTIPIHIGKASKLRIEFFK